LGDGENNFRTHTSRLCQIDELLRVQLLRT
jgi:hypothetical protein